jgi:hypothetical protein
MPRAPLAGFDLSAKIVRDDAVERADHYPGGVASQAVRVEGQPHEATAAAPRASLRPRLTPQSAKIAQRRSVVNCRHHQRG